MDAFSACFLLLQTTVLVRCYIGRTASALPGVKRRFVRQLVQLCCPVALTPEPGTRHRRVPWQIHFDSKPVSRTAIRYARPARKVGATFSSEGRKNPSTSTQQRSVPTAASTAIPSQPNSISDDSNRLERPRRGDGLARGSK